MENILNMLNDKYIQLITLLKKIRQSLSYSQQEVSLILKKNQSYISKIENLNQILTVNDLFLLCNIYKTKVSELLQNIEEV